MSIVEKRIASGGSDSPNGYEFCLVDGQVACRFGSTTFESTGPDLRDGFFHHVALTVSRNSTTGGKLFVDGMVVLTFDPTALNGSLINGEPLRIGNHPALDLNCFFKGIIDEISLYNRALATNEIAAIYNAGSAGKCTPSDSTNNCVTPPPGLLSCWRAEGNAMDNTGPNNGTLAGGTSYAPGLVGQAFSFNNVGDQVSTPTSGFPAGTNSRTIECWVFIKSFIPGAESLFAVYGPTGTPGQCYGIGAYTDQRLYFSQWGLIVEGPVLTTNQWYHVAVTSEGTNDIILYLNGTNVASGSLPFDTPAGSQMFIGGVNAPYNTRQLIGLIDEVSIYNRALSSNEIASIYNAGSAGKCLATTPHCAVYTNFNSTAGLSLIGNASVTNGVLRLTPAIPGQTGDALAVNQTTMCQRV